jgi:hypothetical protein
VWCVLGGVEHACCLGEGEGAAGVIEVVVCSALLRFVVLFSLQQSLVPPTASVLTMRMAITRMMRVMSAVTVALESQVLSDKVSRRGRLERTPPKRYASHPGSPSMVRDSADRLQEREREDEDEEGNGVAVRSTGYGVGGRGDDQGRALLAGLHDSPAAWSERHRGSERSGRQEQVHDAWGGRGLGEVLAPRVRAPRPRDPGAILRY